MSNPLVALAPATYHPIGLDVFTVTKVAPLGATDVVGYTIDTCRGPCHIPPLPVDVAESVLAALLFAGASAGDVAALVASHDQADPPRHDFTTRSALRSHFVACVEHFALVSDKRWSSPRLGFVLDMHEAECRVIRTALVVGDIFQPAPAAADAPAVATTDGPGTYRCRSCGLIGHHEVNGTMCPGSGQPADQVSP
jgi:hypothetical protein